MSKNRENLRAAVARGNEQADARQGLADFGAASALQAQAQAAPSAPVLVPDPPKPKPTLRIVDGAIHYTDPTIDFGRSLFVDVDGSGRLVQVSKVCPKVAVVIAGAIVIEEMNLTVPMAGTFVRS